VLALDPRVVNAVWTAVQGHLPPRPSKVERWHQLRDREARDQRWSHPERACANRPRAP